MRFGLWGIAAVLLGALLAQALLPDRGYVLIEFRGYTAEMSVPGLVLVFAAAYLAVRLAVGLLTAPRSLAERFERAKIRRAGGRLAAALLRGAEGDWAKSERLLTRGYRRTRPPLANCLLAARAAQLQGSPTRRDAWLKLAFETQPRAETPILLARAQLQLEGGEHARALATLRRIARRKPKHPEVLALLARACVALDDREQLADLLPRFRYARLAPEALLGIALPALQARLRRAELTAVELDRYWKALPAALRRAPEARAVRARALQRLGKGARAERELRAALRRAWQPPLVAAYGEVEGKDHAKQLGYAESRLKDHPEDAVLLAATARLCMRGELWGQARSYLESSLALEPDAARYALYGRLLDRLGEADRAGVAFRSGLALLEHGRTALTALSGPSARLRAP